MPVKKRKAPRKKLSTRFKQAPIETTKREFNKLGLVGKAVVISTIAGATSLQLSQQINGLPIIGGILSAFTSAGARLRSPRQ